MDLNERYARWERVAREADSDEPDAPRLSKEQLKDVKFSLGKPLTEEQFKEHRRKGGAQVVGSVKR